MRQRDFANLIGVSQSTVCEWNKQGWLVHTDSGIDAEASKKRIIAERGSLRPASKRQNSMRSPWRLYPSCKTPAAREAWLRMRGGAA
jgi:uncharacterized protein YjcR